ncbi:hypothetical protein HK100_011530 [Physocladia obscura]|uniref:Argininosuccinate lyase n=1 Tax=Physocladia obscura TaxID=109957 RepID=A0AAD5T212_9FUNG|nr:hypothetical protein HK100_011530 [Physocladia obscura]
MSLWGGRFTGKVDPVMEQFNASMRFDQRMWEADIRGSQTYARALALSGVVSVDEGTWLVEGLEKVADEWRRGAFIVHHSDEDIHTANERRLTELVGSALGGRLHTGRSRNDQVATDARLFVRGECSRIGGLLKELISVCVNRALAEKHALMPGFTHLQNAQPIRWAHFLLGHAFAWQHHADKLQQLQANLNRLPLGSGALAGNPFNVDRTFMAKDLAFDKPIPNSLYAVGDRDFIADFLSWAALAMVHFSRISEDLIIYSSQQFAFVRLADAYSTGSSLMPQKKNPDSLELIRGKAGRVFGNHAAFMMTMKGLPSTYNKDLQEDKEPLFDSIDTLDGCIKILTGVLSTLEINETNMKKGLSFDMLATDIAEYLVRKKVPFRETHHIAGQAIKLAEDRKISVNKLTVNDFKSLHSAFDEDIANIWDFERSVETRNAYGGTSLSSVLVQIQELKQWLGEGNGVDSVAANNKRKLE